MGDPFRRVVYNLASIIASSGLDTDVTVTTHDGHPRTGTLELDHDDIVLAGLTWIPIADVARIDVHAR